MRKSFTRLLSLVMLIGMIFLQAVAFGANPLISGRVPADGFANYDGRTGTLNVTLTFDQNVEPGAAHAGIIGLYLGGAQVDPIQISGTTSTSPLTGSSVVINNKVVTITFNRTMVQGDQYFITASGDALRNGTNEYWAGLTNVEYDITIGDFTAPSIALVGTVPDFTPEDGTSAFALDGILEAVFTEPITFGTGNIGIYTAAGDVVELFDAAAGLDDATPADGVIGIDITGGGNTLYINPTADLNELEKYYVRIAPTAITDIFDPNFNAFAGINNNTTWNFQAADITAPTLTFIPPDGDLDIQQSQQMIIRFADHRTTHGLSFEVLDNAGDPFTIGDDLGPTGADIVIFQEGGVDVAGANYTATYTAVNEITFAWEPGHEFAHLEDYTFGIVDNEFQDEEGNFVVDGALTPATADFTSGDFESPVFTAIVAEAAGADIAGTYNDDADDLELAKIYLEADMADDSDLPVVVHYWIVDNGATAPTADVVMGGPVLTLDPLTLTDDKHYGFATTTGAGVALASETEYDIYFAAVDNATVPNTSTDVEVVVTLQTVETSDIITPVPTAKVETVPSVTAVTIPSGGAVSNVEYDSPVTITFDETVVAATGNVTVKYFDTALATPAWVTLGDAGVDYTFTFAANTITIDGNHADIGILAAAEWKSQGQYRVYLDNNEIVDVPVTGTPNPISQKVYEFTVEDYIGPIAVFESNDTDTETDVSTTANIVIDLGEACTRADGTAITAANVFFRDVTAGGTIVPAAITFSGGRYITIDPVSPLVDNGNAYTVELTTTIKDASENPLAYYHNGDVQIAGADEFLDFTTADETQPIITFTPADGSTIDKDALTIAVSINEETYTAAGDVVDIAAGGVNFLRTAITVENLSDHSLLKFDITAPVAGPPSTFTIDLSPFIDELTPQVSYKVTINDLYDVSGNEVTDNSATLTVREYTVPYIVTKAPLDGAINVAPNGNIVMTFNEPVTAIALKEIHIVYDGTALSTDPGPPAWNTDVNPQEDILVSTLTFAGNTVTIPGALYTDLDEVQPYYITLDAGAFEDAVGNVSAAITLATAWNFTSFDATAPTIANVLTDLIPADDAGNPAVIEVVSPTELEITFDENSGQILAGAGKIYIREVGNTGIPDFTFNALSSAVTIEDNVVTISLASGTFQYATEYWVEIEANAFKDPSGNYFAGYVADEEAWNFLIETDPTPQYDVAASVPADDANAVSRTADLAIHFSEPVWFDAATVTKRLTIYDADDAGSEFQVINFSGATTLWSWSTDHKILYVQHDILDDNTNYYLGISAGTFEDVNHNNMAAGDELTVGGLGVGGLNFTTEDNTPPTAATITVGGVSVANALAPNPTGISKSGDIVITFSEPVTISVANLPTCIALTSTDPAGAVAYTATFADNVLTINPTPASLNSEATITVTTVVAKIFDQATGGVNDFGAVQIGQYVVQDYAVPTWDDATATVTAGNNKFTLTNISVNEDNCKVYYYVVPAGTLATTPIAATVKANATGFEADFDAAETTFEITGLLGDTAYDIYIVAEDDIPNLMANGQVIARLAQSTLDNVAPQLLTTSRTSAPIYTAGLNPADGAPCVATVSDLLMYFNEPMVVADASKVWVRSAVDNTSFPLTSVIATDPTVYHVITINPNGSLAQKVGYYVEVNPGAFTDAAGNEWPTADVFYGTTRWNFTTRDETAPLITNVLTKLTPADGATTVAVNSTTPLTMVFDEPMAKNTTANVYIDIYRAGTATPHERINVLSSAVTVGGTDNKTITINRSNIYASEQEYYVLIPANAFYDQSCSPVAFAGYAAPGNWNFFTDDATAPVARFFEDDGTTQFTGATVDPADIATVKIKFYDTVLPGYEALFNTHAAIVDGTSMLSYVTVRDEDNAIVPLASAVYSAAGGLAPGTITITPDDPFTSNNSYTVTITGGTALEDDRYNDLGTQTVTFDTQDRLSPVVTITAQSINAATPVEAKVGTTFRITFDKHILNSSVGGTDNLAPTKAEMEVVGDYFTFKEDPTGANTDVDYTITVVTPGLVYDIVPDDELNSEAEYEIAWVATTGIGGSGIVVQDDLYLPTDDNNMMSYDVADMTFDFLAEDVINPTMDGLTPVDGGVPANLTADIVISFDEAVKAGTGNIQIRFANGQIFDEIPVADCDFSNAADVLTGDYDVAIPHAPFQTFMGYYVVIPAGAIVDNSFNENPYAGFQNNTTWNFTTDDGTDPTAIAYSPANNDVDIEVTSNLVITFDENIAVGAGNLVIYFNNGDAGSNGNAMEIIPIGDPRVTISGTNMVDVNHDRDKITINPNMTFDFHAPGEYYVRIDEGWVQDLAGNDYAGIHDNITWRFGITDPTIPTLDVTSLNPANDEVDVPQTLTGVSMTFDRDVLPYAGTESRFIKLYQYVYNATTYAYDTRLIESINVNDVTVTGPTVTFDVATKLLDDMVYYFLADNGSFTNTASSHDWWGGITDPFTWRFTTLRDVIAPVLDGALAVAATNVGATCLDPDAVSFDINFIEDNGIQIGTGGLKVYTATGTLVTTVPVSSAEIVGNKITFTVPASVLADKTEYYVMLDGTAVKDQALEPNFFDSSVIAAGDWTFYTGDFTAPVLDTFTPVNGTNNLANSVTLTMNFSEPVQPGTEPLVVTRLDNSEVVYNAVLTPAQISGSVANVPVTGLVDSKTYEVTFGAGLVKDLTYTSNSVDCGNLNNLAALATNWRFSIDDNAAPTLVGLPIGTNAPGTVNITITASEAVTPVAGKMVTLTATGHTPIEILAIDLITTDNLVFTKSVAGLADLTTYTVAVASGAFIDAAVVANATEAISWTFTTGDNTAPSVTETTPTGTIATYIGTVLTVTFDEPVLKGTGTITIGAMSIPVSSENVSVTNNVVTITPTSNLGFMPYTVTVPAGAFKDGNNNLSALTTWTFSIVDGLFNSSCMSATHFTPFDETLGVARNINLVITFCEKVVAGTGNVRVSEMVTVGTALYTDYPVTSGMISTDGLTLTLPITGLVDNTRYGVTIQNGTIKDEAGNAWEGISDVTFWNFTAGDNTAPTVTTTPNTLTNATNAFDVAMVFDENVVNVNSTNVTVSSGTVVVTGSGSSYNARITAADGAVVTLTIGGGIKDASERNSLVPVTRTYTVGDNTAPTLTVTAPATPVTTTFTVGLTFNEPVTIPAGAIVLTGYTNFVLSETDASHYTLTITSLEETTVTIDIPNTIVDNSSNHNAFAGTTLSYTVGDFTAPTVTAAPASGTNMLASFDVLLTFSPDAIVTAAGITVTGATTTNITNVGNVFTVAITAPDNTTVTVTAANTIADEAGNLLAGTRVFTYTTGDNTRPTVVVDPVAANDTVNVFDLTMVFSEHVTIPTGAISVNTPATITYSLLAGNVYNAVITAPDLTTVVMSLSSAIVDDAGNSLTPVTFTYTIGDHTAPTLSNHFPATAEVITNNHPTLEMVFDETVVLGTGFVRITKVGATTPSVTIPITLGTISANTVSLTYDAAIHGGLDRNTNYFVTIDAGAVNDASGNAYAGLSSATAWTFTTGPDWVTPVKPVIDSLKDIYPNPFADFITVSDASKLSKVVITSITGQKVKEVVNPTERIQTSELRSGIYIVSLYVNDAVAKTQRIVKR